MTDWRERLGRGWATVKSRAEARHLFVALPAALLVYTLVLRYLLVDVTQANWDEFNFLREVYVTARGEQTNAFQTAHAHLFGWLMWLEGNELDQILAARHVMFVLAVATAAALGFVGYRLVGGSAGLFAAFVYSSFGYVLDHGTAFRYDSLLVPCYAGAAALLLVRRRPRVTGAIAGGLGGIAAIISLKSVFLLVPLAALAALPLLDPADRRSSIERLASFVVAGVVSTLVFYLLHRLSLAEHASSAGSYAAGAAEKVIDLDKPLPRAGELIATLRWDTFAWGLIGAGLLLAGAAFARDGRVRVLQVLAFASPIASIYLYRNSFPYYYVTILPGVSLLAGYVWRHIELWSRRRLVVVPIALAVTLPVAHSARSYYAHNSDDETSAQRQLIATVHRAFPEPVPYIDRCGMISSFPKVGPFMSTWGMSAYRAAKTDLFPELFRRQRPVFVLANSPALDLSRSSRSAPPPYRWRPGDRKQLKENFVHFWGPLWVAGKSLALAPGERVEIEIYVPGRYVLESRGRVEIDGAPVATAGVIELSAGAHVVRGLDGTKNLTLRWNPSLARPGGGRKKVFKFKGLGLDPPK